jgi:hypothetical protein
MLRAEGKLFPVVGGSVDMLIQVMLATRRIFELIFQFSRVGHQGEKGPHCIPCALLLVLQGDVSATPVDCTSAMRVIVTLSVGFLRQSRTWGQG